MLFCDLTVVLQKIPFCSILTLHSNRSTWTRLVRPSGWTCSRRLRTSRRLVTVHRWLSADLDLVAAIVGCILTWKSFVLPRLRLFFRGYWRCLGGRNIQFVLPTASARARALARGRLPTTPPRRSLQRLPRWTGRVLGGGAQLAGSIEVGGTICYPVPKQEVSLCFGVLVDVWVLGNNLQTWWKKDQLCPVGGSCAQIGSLS